MGVRDGRPRTETRTASWLGLPPLLWLLFCPGCGSHEGEEATGGWSAPVGVGEAGELSPVLGGFATQARLAVADNGQAVVVWERRLADSSEVWGSRFSPEAGWSPAARVQGSDALRFAVNPQVGLDAAGRGFVSWVEFDGTMTRVLVGRLLGTTGFGPAVELERASTSALERFGSDLAVEPGGTALEAWSSSSFLHASFWDGSAWSQPGEMATTGPSDSLGNPRVGLRGRHGMLAWNTFFPSVPHGTSNAQVRVFDVLQGWTAPDLIGAGWSVATSRPAVADDGSATVVVSPVVAVPTGVYALHFNDGMTAGPAERLDEGGPSIFADLAAGPGGGATALLVQDLQPGTAEGSLVARRFVAGQGWSPPQPVHSNDLRNAREADLAVSDQGGAEVAFLSGSEPWLSESAGANAWSAQRIPSGGGRASPPATCSPERGRAGAHEPQVGVDGQGSVLVAWIEWDCVRATVWAQRRPAQNP